MVGGPRGVRRVDFEFNDVVSYDSKWLMDDGVVLEPLVGNRVYHSLACLDRTMVAYWGKEGVNVDKWQRKANQLGPSSSGVCTWTLISR